MTWGGLRGAVGLALAIQVNRERADGNIDKKEADRVLFFVGGIALLTLIVNANSCPHLVRILGITQTPHVKERLIIMYHDKMTSELLSKCPNDVVQGLVKTCMRCLR